jgi:hypothetical protein
MLKNYFRIHNLQKGKTFDPKKIKALTKILIPKTP